MRHPDQQTHDEYPDVIRSEAVPVPPPDGTAGSGTDRSDGYARPGDPVPEDALDDRGSYDPDRTDDPDATDDPDRVDAEPDGPTPPVRTTATDRGDDRVDGARLDDSDETTFHEPAAQPTTFGSATVGGAVAAAALAGDTRATEHDVRDEDVDRSDDGVIDSRDVPAEQGVVGGEGGAPAEQGTGPATAEQGGTGERGEAGAAAEQGAAAEEPAGRQPGAAGELRPDEVPAKPVVALFAEDTANGFRDRWRDVQLRFVDDPAGAAGAARQLVDEAVESLTAALAERRQHLGGWQDTGSSDTEQLRVVVRQYREFLDLLIGR